MLPGGRRLLVLLPSWAVAGYAAAAAQDIDSVALIQKDHAAHLEAAIVRPAVFLVSASNSTGISASRALASGLNSSVLSTTLFQRSKDPVDALVQFLQVLVTAVRKEPFMKAFNDMAKQTTQATTSFKEKSSQLRQDFDAVLTPTLTEDQLVRLAAEYMEKQAHLTANYDERRSAINKRSIRGMPIEVPESFMTVLNTMSSQDAVTATRSMAVNTEVGRRAYCKEVGKAMDNITKAEKGMLTRKELINGTQTVRPLMKSYLSSVKPELVPRIIWVLNQFLDTEYAGADTVEAVMGSMSKSLSPVLYERLTCRRYKSASAPKPGLSQVMALTLAVWALFSSAGGSRAPQH